MRPGAAGRLVVGRRIRRDDQIAFRIVAARRTNDIIERLGITVDRLAVERLPAPVVLSRLLPVFTGMTLRLPDLIKGLEDEMLAVVLQTQGDLPPEIGEDLIRPVFVDPVNRQPFLRPARRTAVMMNVENRHHSLVETEINDILHPIEKGRLESVLGIVDVEVPAPSDRQPNGVDSLRLVKTDETARNALVAPV